MKLKYFKVRKKSFQTRNHPSNLLQEQKRRRKHPSRLPFQPTTKGQKIKIKRKRRRSFFQPTAKGQKI